MRGFDSSREPTARELWRLVESGVRLTAWMRVITVLGNKEHRSLSGDWTATLGHPLGRVR